MNELKSSLSHYRDLVVDRDKQIDELKNELQKIKSFLDMNTISANNVEKSEQNLSIKDRDNEIIKKSLSHTTSTTKNMNINLNAGNNNNSTKNLSSIKNSPSSQSKSPGLNIFNSSNTMQMRGFKLDFKNKLKYEQKCDANLCSERSSNNNSLINKALSGTNNNNQNQIGYYVESLKGKKVNTTYSNFFRKSNTSNLNNMTKASFLGTNNYYENPKENHTMNQNTKRDFESISECNIFLFYIHI